MDEAKVREHAEAHGQAVVAGDLNKAGRDLTKEGMKAAGEVMPKLPRPVTAAEIVSIEANEAEHVVMIRYRGEDSEATVRSQWAERDGRPMIVDMKVV